MNRLVFALMLSVALLEPAHAAELVVLGIAQDAGHPQMGCSKSCCEAAHLNPDVGHHVACLALVDTERGRRWIFDATPDLPLQLLALDRSDPVERLGRDPRIAGIFLTHAHIGHYTGLMHLGREAMGTSEVPVYAMPRMAEFLRENGPWSQLVSLANIEIRALEADRAVDLGHGLEVTPFLVPHRDEFSETVGFVIEGPQRRALFIPDIDKWERWDRSIEDVLASVDVAYLDGTFLSDGEIPGRAMSEIPHPFIEETMARFATLPESERAKVRFIHLNHTNPALEVDGKAQRVIEAAGFSVARAGERVRL